MLFELLLILDSYSRYIMGYNSRCNQKWEMINCEKLILIMIAVGTLLTACGNDTKEKVQSKSKPTTMKQSQHQIKKENGITTVDGFVLANKKVPLPKNFNPGENANARNHLNQMIQNAKAKGLDIVYRSGFRSYQQQVSLFNSYVQRDGRKAAEKYSSPSGLF
nr:D-alanyl-D-alanine carboxypeptidase family protein [Staphylococcus sp. IVB6181]